MDTPAAPQYFRPEYAPNVELFHCEPLHASLTAEACARRHAQQEDYPCADCPTGALHAARLGIRVVRGKTRVSYTRPRSDVQTSELQTLMPISYAVFCFKKKKQ